MAGMFIAAGGYKLTGDMNEAFVAWGFPASFALIVGTLELVAGVCLLIPRIAGWAALGLMALMVGAAGTHLVVGEYFLALVPAVALIALGLIVRQRQLFGETGEATQSRVGASNSAPHPSPS